MPIPSDSLNKIGELQSQIWPTTSLKASEAAGFEITFENPEATSVSAPELFAEATSQQLIVQFSFGSMSENAMLILIPQETFSGMTAAVRGTSAGVVDETNIQEVRPLVEALIHGICQAVGTARNEAIVATGVSTRFQVASFPPNLEHNEDKVRVAVNVAFDEFSGNLIWVMDTETGHYLAGLDYVEQASPVFEALDTNTSSGQFSGDVNSIDENGLAIIMDIPLEVSVELGRMKMHVRDVVELGAGSIVEIDKAAGEPVDVLVNNRLVARGEVVVIDDNFGVRITEILSIQDRLQKLNEAA